MDILIVQHYGSSLKLMRVDLHPLQGKKPSMISSPSAPLNIYRRPISILHNTQEQQHCFLSSKDLEAAVGATGSWGGWAEPHYRCTHPGSVLSLHECPHSKQHCFSGTWKGGEANSAGKGPQKRKFESALCKTTKYNITSYVVAWFLVMP